MKYPLYIWMRSHNNSHIWLNQSLPLVPFQFLSILSVEHSSPRQTSLNRMSFLFLWHVKWFDLDRESWLISFDSWYPWSPLGPGFVQWTHHIANQGSSCYHLSVPSPTLVTNNRDISPSLLWCVGMWWFSVTASIQVVSWKWLFRVTTSINFLVCSLNVTTPSNSVMRSPCWSSNSKVPILWPG